ncbi:uncharacterized protein BN787_00390 [Clostridium sp. CAG:798]|jgi:cell filamentation protein|nr:uncharacterized protein BN787_00390 [Clostridium sp. CAG:798]
MRDIYETYNSKYCYPGTTVLKNKLNIMNIEKLQTYEAKITAAKSLGLRKKGITGDFDVKHIKQIHKYLFEDIYPFAGEFRTENIAKGEFRFAQSEYIEPELENLLNKLKKENYLEGLDKKELAIKLAYYLAELNVLHPFREGNGRTNREFIRQLALKNGYQLDLKKAKAEEILEASIESIVDTKKLEEIIYECLQLGTAPNCP